MVDVNKQTKQQVEQLLKQPPKVDKVKVVLEYEMPEEPSGLQDVNKHKGKGMMYE